MENQIEHQAMISRLHAPDRREAQGAVEYFVARRIPRPLIERLKDPGNDVGIAAVHGLGAIGDAAAMPASRFARSRSAPDR